MEREGYDRTFALPWGQDALIAATAAINPKTVVDIEAGGAIDAHTWIDHVPVLIDSYYGGQSTGEALARVLFGQSPTGKLPMSWERNAEDNPTFTHYLEEPGPGKRIVYSEGLQYGYRFYTSQRKHPLFPFGFGLSYTTFVLSNLKLSPSADPDHLVTVEFDLRNSGDKVGAEVAQVYVGDPSARVPRPVKELKVFAKVQLAAGQSQHVSLPLNRRAFSYWDVATHDWHMDPGAFTITVGNSSEDEQLTGTLDVK
jgi:beta-glucosidase